MTLIFYNRARDVAPLTCALLRALLPHVIFIAAIRALALKRDGNLLSLQNLTCQPVSSFIINPTDAESNIWCTPSPIADPTWQLCVR